MIISKKTKDYIFIGTVLFFLTLTSIGINGYFFGEYDQSQMLVFQKSLYDSSLFKNDAIINVRDYYFTYFFRLLVFPIKILGLQNAYFLFYFILTYLFLASVFLLAKTLFKDDKVAYLSSILLAINKNVIGSETIFPAFFPRMVAFPFLLFAIYFFVNKKYFWSFVIIGIIANIHITSAFHL